MIPRTFEEWKKCITEDCKIALTPAFAKQRLTVYQNSKNPETQKFLKLYGPEHLNNIINWLQRV